MGVFKAIFELIGLSKGEPVPTVADASVGASSHSGEDDDAVDEDSTRDGQLDIEEEWAELQMLIHRCEAESLDLAGLDIADPKTFWARQTKISRAQGDGNGRLDKWQAVLIATLASASSAALAVIVARYFMAA